MYSYIWDSLYFKFNSLFLKAVNGFLYEMFYKWKKTGDHFKKKFRTKGTACIILIDLKCKDDDARFTTVPLKPYLINYVEEMVIFLSLKLFSLIIPTCSPTGFPAAEMGNST